MTNEQLTSFTWGYAPRAAVVPTRRNLTAQVSREFRKFEEFVTGCRMLSYVEERTLAQC